MSDRIPLALLPGLLTDAALWAHQIEALADLVESRGARTPASLEEPILADRPPCAKDGTANPVRTAPMITILFNMAPS